MERKIRVSALVSIFAFLGAALVWVIYQLTGAALVPIIGLLIGVGLLSAFFHLLMRLVRIVQQRNQKN